MVFVLGLSGCRYLEPSIDPHIDENYLSSHQGEVESGAQLAHDSMYADSSLVHTQQGSGYLELEEEDEDPEFELSDEWAERYEMFE